jgi:hypothetical protein
MPRPDGALVGALVSVLPVVPMLVGLAASIWRFRADDPVGGLASGVGGVLLTIAAAVLLPDGDRPDA